MVLETSQYLFYYTHRNVASLRRVALNEKKDEEQVGSELLVVFWTSHSTTHEQADTIRNKHWCQLWYHSQNTQSCPGISWYLYGSPYFYFCIYFWLCFKKLHMRGSCMFNEGPSVRNGRFFVLIPGCIVLWLNHVIRFQNVLFCFQIVRNIKVYSKYFQLTATKFEEACAITLSVSIHYRTYYTWMLNLSQSFQMPEEVKADMKS